MAFAAVGLQTAIWNNNIRSVILLVLYPMILAGIVWAVAVLYGLSLDHALGTVNTQSWDRAVLVGNGIVTEWWPAILGVVSIWCLVSFFFHANMVRMLSGAHPVTRMEEPAFYNLLENLCISRGLPMPRLEIVETEACNAFASGIGWDSYSITVTRGLLQSLQNDELEAVLAHELTHIMNNDVRLLIISVIFVGMLGLLSQLVWSYLRRGMRYRSRSRGDGRLWIFLLAVALILWVGYLVTLFTRFALSRRREYMADAGSVELTKNPEALMRALMRIAGHDRIPDAGSDIAMMCIENSQPFFGIFSTHPSLSDRLQEISGMTQTPIPDLAVAAGAGPWGNVVGS